MNLPIEQHPFVEKDGRVSRPWLLGFVQKAVSWVDAPSAHNSNGIQGQIAYDSTHFYVCVAKNSWVRVSLASW